MTDASDRRMTILADARLAATALSTPRNLVGQVEMDTDPPLPLHNLDHNSPVADALFVHRHPRGGLGRDRGGLDALVRIVAGLSC